VPLDILNVRSPNGDWTLEINDAQGVDVGTLLAWSLTIGTGTLTAVPVSGNAMDQDADAQPGQPGVDAAATPRPLSGVPFQAPFDRDTLPLVVPGPRLVGSNAVGPGGVVIPPTGGENLALNTTVAALEVTFDRDMQAPASRRPTSCGSWAPSARSRCATRPTTR
jgi:hypothetical protein